MNLFQAVAFYKPYLDDFNRRLPEFARSSFNTRLRMLIRDRFMDLHVLKPILDASPRASFSVANDDLLMRSWAKEHGLRTVSRDEILLAQIEESQAEVFYTLHPKVFNADFVRRLPGCVKTKVAWLAAPDDGLDFSCYDAMVSNFPPLLSKWKKDGINAYEFFPGVDARVVSELSQLPDRPVKISFAGQYSPTLHHRRNALLVSLARDFREESVSLRLQNRKWKPLFNIRGVRRLNSPIRTLPVDLRSAAGPAVYGRQLYELFGASQVVFNGTIDFANDWRVNMRCFEIAVSGACMVGDFGRYSPGFVEGEMFATYRSEKELFESIRALLDHPDQAMQMGRAAQKMVLSRYNKERQWSRFQEVISSIY